MKNSKKRIYQTLVGPLITLVFVGGVGGCPDYKAIRSLALVNSYCIGNHGVLYTGDQVAACCTCSPAGTAPAGASGDSFAAGSFRAGLAGSLHCRLKEASDTPDPRASSLPCPSGLSAITKENNNSAKNTFGGIQSIGQALASLTSGGSTVAAWQQGRKISTGTTTTSNALGGVGAAASAGGDTSDGLPAGRGSRSVATNTDGQSATPGKVGGRSAGGGGGGSGSSSSGDSSSMGGGTTQAVVDAAATAGSGAKGDTNTAAAGYAAGGAANAAGAGGEGPPTNEVDGSKVDWGLGGADAAVAGSGTTDAPGADVGAQLVQSEDPSDYFTRLQASEDIFKKIEEKYHEKSSSLTP